MPHDQIQPEPRLPASQKDAHAMRAVAAMRWISACFALALLLAPWAADAKGKGGGSRPSYGGGKHTSSHGGHYQGGKGSSHKGGDYKNSKSNDRYGKHK